MDKKFELGKIVATPGALETFTQEELQSSLVRHSSGDWGDLCATDKRENQRSLKENCRLMSAYKFETESNVRELWIITEWDRSVTTFLLPDEY